MFVIGPNRKEFENQVVSCVVTVYKVRRCENGDPNSQSRGKLSKKNGIKFMGYTIRLQNHVKFPPPPSQFLSEFSELVKGLLLLESRKHLSRNLRLLIMASIAEN